MICMCVAAPVREIPPLLRLERRRVYPASRLAPILLETLRRRRGRYIEPFLGNAEVFLHLRACGWRGKAVLSDIFFPVMEIYRALQRPGGPETLAQELRTLASYGAPSEARELAQVIMNAQLQRRRTDIPSLAACFLYLNRCAASVPQEEAEPLPALGALCAVSKAFRKAELRCCNVEDLLSEAGAGDVVYANPPAMGSVWEHLPGGFPRVAQVRLRDALRLAWERGATILSTHVQHPFLLELYGQAPFTCFPQPGSGLMIFAGH
jgi:DNA adenine methylase